MKQEKYIGMGVHQATISVAVMDGGLAQPFLILILEGAPLLSRLLRQDGDFDLHELRMPSQVPRPVPAKNAGTRTGRSLVLSFYLEGMAQPPTSRQGTKEWAGTEVTI